MEQPARTQHNPTMPTDDSFALYSSQSLPHLIDGAPMHLHAEGR